MQHRRSTACRSQRQRLCSLSARQAGRGARIIRKAAVAQHGTAQIRETLQGHGSLMCTARATRRADLACIRNVCCALHGLVLASAFIKVKEVDCHAGAQ